MKQFEYKHTLELTPEQFILLKSLFTKKKRLYRWLAFLVAGVACLFWAYTLILGIVLLGLLALSIFMPKILPAGAAETYRQSPHLHQPLIFSVSDSGLRVQGKTLDLQCTWPNLKVWNQRDGWLILSPTGMQELFFKVEDLKNAGIFDDIMYLAKQHGVEYNSPKKKRNTKIEQTCTRDH